MKAAAARPPCCLDFSGQWRCCVGLAARTAIGNTCTTTCLATVDIVYSILLLSGLGFAWFMDDLTLDTALISFAVAGTVAVVATGKDYIGRQFIQAYAGRSAWLCTDLEESSPLVVAGCCNYEASFNAHAYLVTLIAGPSAFAPLAAAALFMKPLNMCSSSLVQLERPAMARAIAESQFGHALRLEQSEMGNDVVLARRCSCRCGSIFVLPKTGSIRRIQPGDCHDCSHSLRR